MALLCVLALWLVGWLSWCYAVFFRSAAGVAKVPMPCFSSRAFVVACSFLPANPRASRS